MGQFKNGAATRWGKIGSVFKGDRSRVSEFPAQPANHCTMNTAQRASSHWADILILILITGVESAPPVHYRTNLSYKPLGLKQPCSLLLKSKPFVFIENDYDDSWPRPNFFPVVTTAIQNFYLSILELSLSSRNFSIIGFLFYITLRLHYIRMRRRSPVGGQPMFGSAKQHWQTNDALHSQCLCSAVLWSV